MKHLKDTQLFVIPVPMDSTNIIKKKSLDYYLEWKQSDGFHYVHRTSFDFKILGTVTAEHIDFDPASVVESWKSTMPYDFDGYDVYPIQHMDYMDGFFKSSFSAYDSLRSLLTANDVHFVNPYGEKPSISNERKRQEKCIGYSDYGLARTIVREETEKWQQAESKLVEKILILKPL